MTDLTLKRFKKRNGYYEYGKSRKGGISLLIRYQSSLSSALSALKSMIKTAKIKRVIVQSLQSKPIYPEDETEGVIVIVDSKKRKGNAIVTTPIICIGSSKMELSCKDLDALTAKVNDVISSFKSVQLKATVVKTEKAVVVETVYYDEDDFERFTMSVAKAVAPLCPLVNSVYAYPPVKTDEYLSQVVGYITQASERIEHKEEKESFLPLTLNKRAVLIEIEEATEE